VTGSVSPPSSAIGRNCWASGLLRNNRIVAEDESATRRVMVGASPTMTAWGDGASTAITGPRMTKGTARP
jgi:hypothetical protein